MGEGQCRKYASRPVFPSPSSENDTTVWFGLCWRYIGGGAGGRQSGMALSGRGVCVFRTPMSGWTHNNQTLEEDRCRGGRECVLHGKRFSSLPLWKVMAP